MVMFEQSKEFKLPFGKYRGQTIDSVASTDEGLRYLDWLREVAHKGSTLEMMLCEYLDEPTIKEELRKALENE